MQARSKGKGAEKASSSGSNSSQSASANGTAPVFGTARAWVNNLQTGTGNLHLLAQAAKGTGPMGGGEWQRELRRPVLEAVQAAKQTGAGAGTGADVATEKAEKSTIDSRGAPSASPASGAGTAGHEQEGASPVPPGIDPDCFEHGSVMTRADLEASANPFGQWFRFDDSTVEPVAAREAMDENFGTRLRPDGSWETYGRSAYMLVYVSEEAAEEVCFEGALQGEGSAADAAPVGEGSGAATAGHEKPSVR